MGGKQKKTTTNTYKPPAWVESNASLANQIGRRIGNTQFQAYGGERVAGLSDNERAGINLARSSVGVGQPYYDQAEEATQRATQSWADADQSRYINPYIKGALDPAAREIREEGQRGAMALDARASSMDAFGGSRAALMRSENREATLQGVSDLYGKGYAAAYDFAAQTFGAERARDLEAAGRFSQLGDDVRNAAQVDISTLMTTGATDRSIQQAVLDFDWQQFVEERDWDFRSLMGVISALEGTKGSYTTTQTGETVVEKNNAAEVVGAIATVVASAYSDERLKENIAFLGYYMGERIYTWTWKPVALALGIVGPNIGVIAQEVDSRFTLLHPSGFLMVNYRKLFGGQS